MKILLAIFCLKIVFSAAKVCQLILLMMNSSFLQYLSCKVQAQDYWIPGFQYPSCLNADFMFLHPCTLNSGWTKKVLVNEKKIVS